MTAGLLADRYLALIPPSFAPRPTDWPDHARLTGFCAWDGGRHTTTPGTVEDYLAAGEPPVLVTMGSALSTGLTAVLQHIAAELDRRRVRALFLVGAGHHLAGALADRVDVAEFAPLDRVLPSCRAVVHHGGYGTTVATLRVGLPAVTVSPMPDQLWYGRRVEAIGAGIALPWRRRRHVAAAIDRILADTSYTTAAAHYRERTRHDDGIAETCTELDLLLPR
jgi:sterol 3beta-glucosyltransferase